MYEVSSSSSGCSHGHGGRCGPDPTAGCGGRGALETSGVRSPNSLPELVACNPRSPSLCLVLQLQLPHIYSILLTGSIPAVAFELR